SFNGEIIYAEGRSPIEIQVFNPLEVVDGEFQLTFVDENMNNDRLDDEVRWELRSLSDPNSAVIVSNRTIDRLNEQIIRDYGFSITIGQTDDVGDKADDTNGLIGYQEEYTDPEAVAWLTGIPEGLVPGPTALDEVIFDFVSTKPSERDAELDPAQALSNVGPGYFVPYMLADWRPKGANNGFPIVTPAWTDNSGSNVLRSQMDLQDLNNVDIVLTPDKELWSRCVVVETANRFYEELGFLAEGDRDHFDLRAAPNVTRFDEDGDGLPDIDTEDPGQGMGWFPGYAIDVETGQRLNIFFGENSAYDGELLPELYESEPAGADMMFNPSAQLFLRAGGFVNLYDYMAGGQHFVYVTKTPYDECALFRDRLGPAPSGLFKVRALKELTWTGLIMSRGGTEMLSYQEGLIPEEIVIKLRVDNPYQVAAGTGEFDGYPTYRFTIEGKEADELTPQGVETALDMINVAPNPYFGFSDYEVSQFTTTVKITNLPAKCTVTIYSLDGKFIRQYRRDEQGQVPRGNNRAIEQAQIVPDLEWDLKNSKGIPISSGVYLIHVEAESLGSRTIKWFGVNRKFDPSGL
ncbi:MAG: T9SS type A sorting domain-containing protein, partial [Saprospiraceae bacterium]|nr:T9SS type A sorting domain-containing protein [Saprospiraceae bacterium]